MFNSCSSPESMENSCRLEKRLSLVFSFLHPQLVYHIRLCLYILYFLHVSRIFCNRSGKGFANQASVRNHQNQHSSNSYKNLLVRVLEAMANAQYLLNEAIAQLLNLTFQGRRTQQGQEVFIGSETEAALLQITKELNWRNAKEIRDGAYVVQMVPFSSEAKSTGVVVKEPLCISRVHQKSL